MSLFSSCSYTFRTYGLLLTNWQINLNKLLFLIISLETHNGCPVSLYFPSSLINGEYCSSWLLSNDSVNTMSMLAHEKPDTFKTKHETSATRWWVKDSNTHKDISAMIHTSFCPNTHKRTHVRPQPGPSDWLLLPACCILDRSMCSTYV